MAEKISIPFFGLTRQYAALRDELLNASDKVYSSGQVLDGNFTASFEGTIAARTNRKFAIAVNSCSTALLFTYMYYGSRELHNVALPAFSFIATENAAALTGRKMTFADVDDNGLMNLDVLRLRDDNIQLISYVNLYGNILDYDRLLIISSFFNEQLPIIEDAAQSFGASYKGIPSGKLGDVSCLSFDPTKNLPNYGSGGMVLTDDPELAFFVKNMRNNGKESTFTQAGTNSKMSEADCAQMLVKLKYFDAWQARRNKIAEYYNDCLHPFVECPKPNPGVVHAWHKYVIRTADQFTLRNHLLENGIDTKIHYADPLPSSNRQIGESACCNATVLGRTSLSLPIYPELSDSEIEKIVDAIQKFYH